MDALTGIALVVVGWPLALAALFIAMATASIVVMALAVPCLLVSDWLGSKRSRRR